METVFSQVLNMSLTGSAVILVVILARLLLKRFPKIFSYALWAVVLFRLLCPVSLSGSLSMLDWFQPEVTTVSERTSAVSYLPVRYVYTSEQENLPQPTLQQDHDSQPSRQKTSPSLSVMTITAYLWAAGVCLMVLRSVIQYLGLHRKLIGSIVYRGEVYLADYIDTPFTLGILRPRIYLPFQTPQEERRYIIAHERHHIRRGDHVMKLLAYGALCIHWFNPLVWAAFLLAGKDMEMSCDEAVIRKLGEHIRADYSATLLRMATHKHTIAASPLAFGEGDTKGRIQNMAQWKKPKLWVSVLCLTLCIAVFAACAVNPAKEESTQPDAASEIPGTPETTAPTQPSVEETQPTYQSEFTNRDGRVSFHIDAPMPQEIEEGVILEAVPHYLTEEDVKRAAYAIFGEDAYFTEMPPQSENYIYTQEQLKAAIERMEPYTTREAWGELSGSTGLLYGFSRDQRAQDTARLIEEYHQKLDNFRLDYPEEPCKWTWQNAEYYSYAPENASASAVSEAGDAIAAFVEKDGISYNFRATIRDKEGVKISSIFVTERWPAGCAVLDSISLRRKLCITEPTQEQIAQAGTRAEQILSDMQLGNWEICEVYVEVITDINPESPEYRIHIYAVPMLEGGADVRRKNRGHDSQASEAPEPDNYYMSCAEFQFAPGGELLALEFLSPMDTTVVSRTNAVYSVAGMLDVAEETLKNTDINGFGVNVEQMDYAQAECEVTISEIQTGMARIRVEGTEDTYQYVPALSFLGNVTYILDGKPQKTGIEICNILTINALDGSVLDNYGA